MKNLLEQLRGKGLFNGKMLSKLQKCTTVEEIVKLSKDNNVECTPEQAQVFYDNYCVSNELSDDELENVSGGCGGGGGGGLPKFRVMVIPNGKYGTAQAEGQEGDTYIVYYDEGGSEWWTTKDLEFLD